MHYRECSRKELSDESYVKTVLRKSDGYSQASIACSHHDGVVGMIDDRIRPLPLTGKVFEEAIC